jgi:Uma2 family endonuclease
MSTIARFTLEEYDRMIAAGVFDERNGRRLELIRGSGIRDYWIVNVPEKCVEVRPNPQQGQYGPAQHHRREEEVRPLAFPEMVLRPSMLWPAGDQ